MNEERIQILRMVAQGKITPEEGERLLQALEDAHGGQAEPGDRSAGQGKFPFTDFEIKFGNSFDRLAEIFSHLEDKFKDFDPFKKGGPK